MANPLPKSNRLMAGRDSVINNVMSLIEGHDRFMTRNTGLTVDPQVQHYVTNPDGVLSNNRHFIGQTRTEYQPNGDGTSEGQTLEVLGYAYVYLATKDPKYLEKAIWYWEAYVKYYYANTPIPDTPKRWICNWILNSKEPCLANWPINPVTPTQGGYKCVPLRFVNGLAQVPHGSPFWGEYLDVISIAHRGHMTWDAINGSVQALSTPIDWEQVYTHRVTAMPEKPYSSLAWVNWDAYLGPNVYTPDWNNKLPEFTFNWINAWTNKKIEVDSGDIIGDILPADVGKIQLNDTSINGVYFVNYAVRLPVEHGGYMFKRNEVWHNRPIHTPLLGSVNQMGNAADGEEWFLDACHVLWKITGEERYKKAMDACLFTLMEYTDIDSGSRFFRQDITANTPFTDGISYDFTYPSNTPVTYGRDALGYGTVKTDTAVDVALEQQAISFRIDQHSSLRVTYGGTGNSGGPVTVIPRLLLSLAKVAEAGDEWIAALPESTDMTVKEVDIPLSQFVQVSNKEGVEYILADIRSVTSSDDIIAKSSYAENILDGRNVKVVDIHFPNDDGWCAIGFYLLDSEKSKIQSITYKANKDYNLRFQDDNNWRYWWMLPATDGEWVTKAIIPEEGTLSGYQPDADGRPEPTDGPVYDEIEDFSILFDDSSSVDGTFSYYCINTVPPRYTQEDGYTLNFRLTLGTKDANGINAIFGDCKVIDYRLDNLSYTPGLVPFSNIYEEGTNEIGAWRGIPYPGYQYPFIYCLDPDANKLRLDNMVEFLFDSQQFYYQEIGELGPGASAYIWDRWDNLKYGVPNQFTMYHWGDGTAWSGYQPRAFQGACRAWQELAELGKPIHPKLKAYVENWINWLADYCKRSNNATPTDFPATTPPVFLPNDFTSHMCGLWLAGSCMAAMGGCTNPNLPYLIETCVTELHNNYLVSDIPKNNMNGCWTVAPRLTSDNGMFFGFHSGEVLRGLGMYILYKRKGPNKSIF